MHSAKSWRIRNFSDYYNLKEHRGLTIIDLSASGFKD